MILTSIHWNIDPEIFRIGRFAIRYYGVLWALSFYLGYIIFNRFVKKEGLPEGFLDSLTIYTAVGTILGARLGHCLFYEPDYYLSHPLEILKIWQGGLASHGAAIGIIIALYLFSKKHKVSMIYVLDRIVITVALAGCFIRVGNLMNSEIYGVETNSKYGFVFVRPLVDDIKRDNIVTDISFQNVSSDTLIQKRFVPMNMTLEFQKGSLNKRKQLVNEEFALEYSKQLTISYLANDDSEKNLIAAPNTTIELKQSGKDIFYTTVSVIGIPKHPTQLYEAFCYLIIFFALHYIYNRAANKPRSGLLFGLFLVGVFAARFIIEYVKEPQVEFEKTMSLDMGQILSIPFILAGIGFIIYSYILKRREDYNPS